MTENLKSKGNIALLITVVILVVVAISMPIYISTLNKEDQNNDVTATKSPASASAIASTHSPPFSTQKPPAKEPTATTATPPTTQAKTTLVKEHTSTLTDTLPTRKSTEVPAIKRTTTPSPPSKTPGITTIAITSSATNLSTKRQTSTTPTTIATKKVTSPSSKKPTAETTIPKPTTTKEPTTFTTPSATISSETTIITASTLAPTPESSTLLAEVHFSTLSTAPPPTSKDKTTATKTTTVGTTKPPTDKPTMEASTDSRFNGAQTHSSTTKSSQTPPTTTPSTYVSSSITPTIPKQNMSKPTTKAPPSLPSSITLTTVTLSTAKPSTPTTKLATTRVPTSPTATQTSTSVTSISQSTKTTVLLAMNVSSTVKPSNTTTVHSPTTAKPENGVYHSLGGLAFEGGVFELRGESNFRILSGAVHYFRTVPQRWRIVLQKLQALGLNTVETYVPWNAHEPSPGQYDFDGILDMRRFIQTAHELGLYVIFRPGPYICSEWDFGGLPAWLLKDPDMKVRSNYPGYKEAVERYFNKLLPLVTDLQISRGGPIIAIQIENEFGSYSSQVEHLHFIKDLYTKHGLTELFLTSDNIAGLTVDPFYQYALPTANFKDFYKDGRPLFDQIRRWSSDFPLMVTEFWTGWFDHWTSQHEGLDVKEYSTYLTEILQSNASVNFYMFHGGTNFGFMNGANKFDGSTYKPDVTSYDYDALLSEAGDITFKYLQTRNLLMEHVFKPAGITTLPEIPKDSTKQAYGSISVEGHVTLQALLSDTKMVSLSSPVPMEMLTLENGIGQNYGYVLYVTDLPNDVTQLQFTEAPADRAQIFLDGTEVTVLDWRSDNLMVPINVSQTKGSQQLSILVENHGRVNYGTEESAILNNQRKGVSGQILANNKPLEGFKIYALQFKPDTVNRSDWGTAENCSVPGLFRASLPVSGEPNDTFLFMKGWGKGIVFINGFNLGRYWSAGPQQTLYVPGPVLKTGANEVVFFEHHHLGQELHFLEAPILNVNDPSTIQL